MRAYGLMIGLAAALALTGCASESGLMNLDAGRTTPDEFAILPTRPLSMPPDLAVLPSPTPGGANITDPTPLPDAVAALGGNPGALVNQGIGAADQALVAHAARNGTDPQIREALAEADARFRERNSRRPLEALIGTSVYYRAYRSQSLDADAELLRWRRAGAITPTSPPPAAR